LEVVVGTEVVDSSTICGVAVTCPPTRLRNGCSEGMVEVLYLAVAIIVYLWPSDKKPEVHLKRIKKL